LLWAGTPAKVEADNLKELVVLFVPLKPAEFDLLLVVVL
jgi:hypothetical protein